MPATMPSQPPVTLLLANDDGIDAPGLAALVKATRSLAQRRVVVAPLTAYSGTGHTVTTDRPIAIQKRGDDRYAVDGTPADCVRLAIHHLVPELSWVVSGINSGANLGGDVWLSGTVAAVREAASHGLPGIAVSQYIARGREVDWTRAARLASGVIARLLATTWETGTFWNVNLPHVMPDAPDPEAVFCPLDLSPMPIAYRLDEQGTSAHFHGDYHARARKAGGDIDVCFRGGIAVSLVRLGEAW